jgi:two-component system, cell cycle response regulator DivK
MAILVVDDNDDNRHIISQMLKIGGYIVLCADDGRQALEMIEANQPELVLMDLAMPGLDGWNATAEITSRPHLAHIPIIAVTGHVTIDELHRAREAGCRDYISKPIDFETLMNKVRAHIAL